MKTLARCSLAIALAIAVLAPSAASAHPGSGIVIDAKGQIYFIDTGAGLWKIDRLGKLTRISDDNLHWLAIDERDALAGVRLPSGSRGDVHRVGTQPTLLLASDFPLTVGFDGALYYPLSDAAGMRMMRLSRRGTAEPFATLRSPAGGRVDHVNGVARGARDYIYYTEDDAIRSVAPNGAVATVAERVRPANCVAIPGNEGGPLLRGLAVDSVGAVYVAASGCGSVLKVSPNGQITTIVQTQSPWAPTAVALYGGDVYVLEYLHTKEELRRAWTPRVRRVRPDGSSTIIATITR